MMNKDFLRLTDEQISILNEACVKATIENKTPKTILDVIESNEAIDTISFDNESTLFGVKKHVYGKHAGIEYEKVFVFHHDSCSIRIGKKDGIDEDYLPIINFYKKIKLKSIAHAEKIIKKIIG